MKNYYKDLFN